MKKLNLSNSLKHFKEAEHYLPAGANSSPRLWRGVCPSDMPCAIFAQKAKGSHIWDVDGNEYIDYRLGFGPVILGHSHPAIHTAVHRADEKGLVYALDNVLEVDVAKIICSMVPCAEKIRYSNSGTEATMAAIRVARGYTGKDKIIKFEGHYHGSHDTVLFSSDPGFFSRPLHPQPDSLGIPKILRDLIFVEEWNQFEHLEQTFRKHHKEIAALICEPVMGNSTVIPPSKGYLKHLRELCDRYNVVLIFDEVKTGFRLGKGGAQQLFHVTPDLATFSKSLGNGYPIAAVTGTDEIMSVIGPKKVFQGGTFSSNPVSLTAAKATLEILKKGTVYTQIDRFGSSLMKGIQKIFDDLCVEAHVQGYPGMFQFVFTSFPQITRYRELRHCNMQLFADVQMELLKEGIMIDEDNGEPLYTCAAHSSQDLKKTLSAFERVLRGDAFKASLQRAKKK